MSTTDPPTLAEDVRRVADECLETSPHYDEERSVLALAADVLGLLPPRTIEMAERVLAETLPDGWTATAASYVVLTHNDGREIVATYCGEPLAERFTWWRAFAPTDDDPDRQVGADTLAELIEAVTS